MFCEACAALNQQISSPSKCLIAYALLSMATTLLGRVVLTKFFFDYPIVVQTLQMAITLAAIEFGRFMPSLFFSMSQYITLNSMDGISLPFYPFVQKFAPFVVLGVYLLFFRRGLPSLQTLVIVMLVCGGAAFASPFELFLDPGPIVYTFLTLAMTGLFQAQMERLRSEGRIESALEMVYLNAFNSLCLFLLADIVQDELRDAYMYLQTTTSFTFLLCLGALVVCGVATHCALVFALTTANALNTSIAFNCASAAQVVVAWLLSAQVFYDTEPSGTNLAAIVTAVGATLFYFISPKDAHFKTAPLCASADGAGGGGGGGEQPLLTASSHRYHLIAQ